jgi:sRNA-binding carbon storage regulator CsrA
MGLKLMLEKGDKVLIGDDTIITVMALGSRPQIHIDAPREVKLIHIKADPEKQFLNRKNKEKSYGER